MYKHSLNVKRNKHKPVPEQGAWLRMVIQGYYNYHAVPDNERALAQIRYQTGLLWYKSLRRRSHKAKRLKWDRMNRYIEKWLPLPKILHPYPEQRFPLSIQGRSRMR